ncbi:hypothetical protein Moror_16741 [Moniliophthora roreri MCA 2997]|uniref:Reverse transcriptase domain-containing protein n=1 Tax=Moniliophthora roreri (strain MCA 2997) TaxID=1381753 RepID=V2WMJ8_MONRO|nr:hypothetical protein Moror_16741 [Moniliophthora roreri MCA 2997]
MCIPLTYNVRTEIIEIKALIDSGAGGRFISKEEARHIKKPWMKLEKPIKVYNVDSTWDKTGWITHSVMIDFSIGSKSITETLLISGLGPERIILELPWLQNHNPDIDWVLAQAHKTKLKPLEELLPPYLSDYTNRFEKKKSERFPPSQPYDYAIDLKPNFKLKDCKVYSLSPKEQIEQDKFLEENLWKGYIRPSKSPIASSFFFVAKKKAGALRPCQDYWDLNNGTIKNRYPLLLVTNLTDKLKNTEMFTKLDLQNRYNNIWIKDRDQWKAVFKTPKGLFKPTVMFFGLMNSLATFQAFMNDILKDFIDEGCEFINCEHDMS